MRWQHLNIHVKMPLAANQQSVFVSRNISIITQRRVWWCQREMCLPRKIHVTIKHGFDLLHLGWGTFLLHEIQLMFACWDRVFVSIILILFSDKCDRVFFFCTVCIEPCNTKQTCSDTSHTQQQPENGENVNQVFPFPKILVLRGDYLRKVALSLSLTTKFLCIEQSSVFEITDYKWIYVFFWALEQDLMGLTTFYWAIYQIIEKDSSCWLIILLASQTPILVFVKSIFGWIIKYLTRANV